jgi:uncharacterized protein (UPF0335 family)
MNEQLIETFNKLVTALEDQGVINKRLIERIENLENEMAQIKKSIL